MKTAEKLRLDLTKCDDAEAIERTARAIKENVERANEEIEIMRAESRIDPEALRKPMTL